MAAPDYYQRLNPDLLQLLPVDARLVVEVGCGAGALGAAYKQLNPHGQYVGIEKHPGAATAAAAHLDRVVVADVEQLDPRTLDFPAGTVDCLVYGDVLEHLVDPWAVLRRHAAWLRPDGVVLACVPNVQHWTVLVSLLRGQWRYQDEGLLDRTHLRFFTLEGIRELFTAAGFTHLDVQPRSFPGADFPRVHELLSPVLTALGVDPAAAAGPLTALQYVVRAMKTAPARRLLIQTMTAPSACDRPRVLDPDRCSNTVPGVRALASVGAVDLDLARPDEDKVFIWQRACIRDPEDLVQQRELLRRGYLVVAEIDDDPWNWPEYRNQDFFTFRCCHAVQTSTEALAGSLRKLNPNVAVFGNQLLTLPPPRAYADDGTVTLFFGAFNRHHEWRPILPALKAVLRRYAGRVRVRVVHDRRFFDALETDAREFQPVCQYDEYQAILRSCDIGLLPLRPTRFNRMKSDLKFLECAGHGVAALASPTVYGQSVRHRETGLLYETPEEFEAGLVELIEDVGLRRRLTANAYEWVGRNRLLSQHFRERLDWYRRMREELPRLNEELRRRAPVLFAG